MIDDIFEEFEKFLKLRKGFLHDYIEDFLPLGKRILQRSFPIDVSEKEREVIIRANLPGFRKDEIEVFVEPDKVEIIARKKKENVVGEERFLLSERVSNYARRVVPLPVKVKPETARARLSEGILEIRIEKVEVERRGRKVEIE